MGSPAALTVYRSLLKTVNKTFRGDYVAIKAASMEIRNAFKANKGLVDKASIDKGVADALEARDFIRDSIVQAKKTGCGTYEVERDKVQHLQEVAPELVHNK